MPRRVLLAAFAALWLLARVVGGQEKPEAPGVRITLPEVMQCEDLSDDSSGKAFAVLGPVEFAVEQGEALLFSVRARRVVLWLDPAFDKTIFALVGQLRKDPDIVPLWAVRALYAEGGQVPAVFQTAGRIFRCSSFYYEFTTHRGLIVDADLRFPKKGASGDGMADIVMRARRLHVTGPGAMVAQEAAFFTTPYHEPDVAITASRVTLEEREVGAALGKLIRLSADRREEGGPSREEVEALLREIEQKGLTREGRLMIAEDVRARVLGIPSPKFPRVKSDGDNPPMRFAVEIGGQGSLDSGLKLGVGLDSRPVSWLVGAGYYDGRGPLFDFLAETATEDGRLTGRTYGVYLHDEGDDGGVVPSTKNRYWTKNQYRFRIDDRWRLDGELADLSDATWLRNFDEREFKEEKEQETLLHLRHRGTASHFSLTAKVQSIGFLDTVEELPRASYAYPALTLLTLGEGSNGEPLRLQLGLTAEAANLDFEDGDSDGVATPGFRTGRVDVDPTLYVSFDAGPVRVVPFAGFRATAYENDLTGGSAGRFAGSAGIRLDTQLQRVHARTRHVINLSVEYLDLYEVSESPAALFPFDAIDRLEPFERVAARVRNRWIRGGRTLLDVELLAAWFPEGRQPFGARGDGLLEFDLRWFPTTRSTVLVRAQVDPDTQTLDTASLEQQWQVTEQLALLVGLRHLDRDSDILTGQAELYVDERWRLLAFSQYDFKNEDSLDQALLIQRLGQTVVVGIRIAYDPGDDNFSFGFKFDMLESFRRQKRREKEWDARGEVGWR